MILLVKLKELFYQINIYRKDKLLNTWKAGSESITEVKKEEKKEKKRKWRRKKEVEWGRIKESKKKKKNQKFQKKLFQTKIML